MNTNLAPKLKIVVCMATESTYHQEIYESFMHFLRRLVGDAFDVSLLTVPMINIEMFALKLHRNDVSKAKVVVSIGFNITRYLLDLFRSTQPRPYLVTIGADIAEEYDVSASRGWLTAVTTVQEQLLDRRGQILMFIKSTIKRVGLFYFTGAGPSLYVQRQLAALRAYFASSGVEVCLIAVPALDRLESRLSEYMRTLDVLMAVESDLLSHEHARVVAICNEFRVPFFASTLSAARAGASIAYGVDSSLPTREAAHVVASLATGGDEQNVKLSIEVSDSRKIIINTAACQRQGLQLTKAMLFFLRETNAFVDIKNVGPLVRDSFI